MRIVFFGTPDLAVPSLASLVEHHDIVGVITQPDRPRGRSGKPEPPPVKVYALSRNLPVLQPEKLHDGSFEAQLKSLAPEVCCVGAFGRLLKQPLLDIPPKGWLNVHPSLLPRWRGPSPIQSALLNGDTETGVTIMRMVLEMDAGDIVLQERTPIGPEETAGELSDRLAVMGARLLIQALELVERGLAPSLPQDSCAATYSKLFHKTHGYIRWAESAHRIHNRVRACNPWPIAQAIFRGQVCRILRTRPNPQSIDAAPGTVVETGPDLLRIATGEGCLDVLQIQWPGKKALDIAAFLRGTPISLGEQFEDCPNAG